jgi:hypothetical protein
MTPLTLHASLLNKHAGLLDEIYRLKSVSSTPKTERDLDKLNAQQILLCDEEGEYRIHPLHRKYFDSIYARNRVFDAGSPISSEIEALDALMVEIKSAGAKGDEIAQGLYTDEAIDAILSLKIEIDRQIRNFDIQTRNGYHDARSMEERLRRNEYYQGRARELSDAVSRLNSPAVRGLFEGPHTVPVRIRYQKDIILRIEGWSMRLAGLIQQMLEFMYRSKEIEARTKRMRTIFHALEAVSAAEQVEALEMTEQSLYVTDLGLKCRADVRSEENEDSLIEAARKLDPDATTGRKRLKHASGVYREAEELAVEEVHPIEMMITRMIELAKSDRQPFSVRAWAKGHAEDHVEDVLMDMFDHMVDGEDGIIMQTVPEKSRHYTSSLQDIVLVPC